MKSKKNQTPDAWESAVSLINDFLKTKNRPGRPVEGLADRLRPDDRRRCQNLFYGVIRNITLIEWAINQNMRRPPKGVLRALLLAAGYELLAAVGGEGAAVEQVVHHAVGKAKRLVSAPEARLANAVLRKVPELLRARLEEKPSDAPGLALRYSHPEWLVIKWLREHGFDKTRILLEWNQRPADDFLRVFGPLPSEASDGLEPTPWPRFYRIVAGGWEAARALLASGRGYIQDPSTRLAPELLSPSGGENVLDLCSAPGGKTLLLADALQPGGGPGPVCLDRPGARFRRLEENLARYPWCGARPAAGELPGVTPADLEARGLPGRYDAVLLDVPCSNTGVFRRRADARWSLTAGAMRELTGLQQSFLQAAAAFVRPGGRLVYSTCSIEPEENREMVEAFVAAAGGTFSLESAHPHFPWDTGHDGGGAFLLRREGGGGS